MSSFASSSKPQRHHATCPHDCPSTCALQVEKRSNTQIGRIYGDKSHPYTDGVICAKVSRYAERIHHPDRLTQPLKRVAEKGIGIEAFTPISWTEALDEVAEKFTNIIKEYGSESLWPYHYAGTMGHVQRDGLNRLRHLLKTSRLDETFCVSLADAGWRAGVGELVGVSPLEMSDSEMIVVWGGNPVHTQVNVMHHIAKARRKNNTKLVVIDPYRTATAEKADLHLMLRPGTDGALACAVMHQLFEQGHADLEYIHRYTNDADALQLHLKHKTPQWASKITGVPEAQIKQFARWYGELKASYIRIGFGFSRQRNGAVNLHAVTCLPAITGAWQYRGGGALYSNRATYPLNKEAITAEADKDLTTRCLDQSRIGQILCGNSSDLAGGPPIKGLLIQNTNPMVVAPESLAVKKGLSRDDLFVCVHEQFMTETAAMADIVLPATMFLEHDDIYTGSGHHYLQYSGRIIEPPSGCKSNHWVINQLCQRLGLEHPSNELDENSLIKQVLADSDLPEKELLNKGSIDAGLDFNTAHSLNGFPNSSKRFHFKAQWSELAVNLSMPMPGLPDYFDVNDKTSHEKPYRLVTAPARHFLNSTFSETLSSKRQLKKPMVMIHPRDAEEIGVTEGDTVKLLNEQGSVILHVKIFDGILPRVVIAEGLWANKDFIGQQGINVLTSAYRPVPLGGAVFHDTAVAIERIDIPNACDVDQ